MRVKSVALERALGTLLLSFSHTLPFEGSQPTLSWLSLRLQRESVDGARRRGKKVGNLSLQLFPMLLLASPLHKRLILI